MCSISIRYHRSKVFNSLGQATKGESRVKQESGLLSTTDDAVKRDEINKLFINSQTESEPKNRGLTRQQNAVIPMQIFF